MPSTIRKAPSTFQEIKPQLVAVLGPFMNIVNVGAILGYTGVALPSLRYDIDFLPTIEQEIWIASIFSFGSMFGPILNSAMVHFMGLKYSLTVASIIAGIGWLLISIAYNVDCIYSGRLINGVASGIIIGLNGVYITEIADNKTRGPLLAVSAGLASFGTLVIATVGTFVSWRYMAVCGVCISFLSTILTAFLSPEPPERQFRKGKEVQALKTLKTLNKNHEQVEEKMLQLQEKYRDSHIGSKENILSSARLLLRSFFSSRCLKPLSIMLTLFFVQQFSGMPAIVFYSVDLLHSVSSGVLDAHYLNIIITAYRMILSFITATLVQRFVIRKILIFTGFLMTLPMLVLGGVSYWELNMNQDQIPDYYMKWLSVLLVFLFITFNVIGIGTIPWVIISVMFPSDIRVFASGISSIISVFFIFLCVFTYPIMVTSIDSYGTYFLFGFVCFFGSIFSVIFVPETENKNLDDIEKHFGNNED